MLKYQPLLNNFIENHNLKTLPHSIILHGPRGCGKHVFKEELQGKLFTTTLVEDKLFSGCVDFMYEHSSPVFYVFEEESLSVKNQNALLKVAEEPPENVWILILSSCLDDIIDPLKGRCVILGFEPYRSADLRAGYSDEDQLESKLKLARTPGDMLRLKGVNAETMLDTAYKIFTKINVATLPNTLTLSDKVAFKQEQDKFDLIFFIRALQVVYKDLIISNPDYPHVQVTPLLINYVVASRNTKIDQKRLFENFLTNLWKVTRGL